MAHFSKNKPFLDDSRDAHLWQAWSASVPLILFLFVPCIVEAYYSKTMGIVVCTILLGVVQGLILGGVLLTLDRGNPSANRVLGLLMILFSITISTHVLFETGFYHRAPHLLGIANPIVFLFGPLKTQWDDKVDHWGYFPDTPK